MNKLTRTLLGGAALAALAVAPGVAKNAHAFHFTALHGGRVVYKSKFHNPHRCDDSSCTAYVYTSVPASDLRKTVRLIDTFYKLNSNSTICNNPTQHLKAPRKGQYGKVGAATETYSIGCPSGPTTFYGNTYKLTDKAGEGKNDVFVSKLRGEFTTSHGTYKGTLYIEANVAIGTQ